MILLKGQLANCIFMSLRPTVHTTLYRFMPLFTTHLFYNAVIFLTALLFKWPPQYFKLSFVALNLKIQKVQSSSKKPLEMSSYMFCLHKKITYCGGTSM